MGWDVSVVTENTLKERGEYKLGIVSGKISAARTGKTRGRVGFMTIEER